MGVDATAGPDVTCVVTGWTAGNVDTAWFDNVVVLTG
jgi:hypothetical protein